MIRLISMTHQKVRTLAYSRSMVRSVTIVGITASLLFFGCDNRLEYSSLSQSDIAQWHVYQDVFINDVADCPVMDIYNYDIKKVKTEKSGDTTLYWFSIVAKDGVYLYQKANCSHIYSVGFVSNSPVIRKVRFDHSLEYSYPYYSHYVKHKDDPQYRGVRHTFMEDTLRKDSLFIQLPRKVFIDEIIKNKATANKWVLEMAYKLGEGKTR